MIPKKVSLKEKKMVVVAELETGNILETLNNLISLRRFMSEVKWAPFNCLFWNANDSVVKLMVSIKSDVSLRYRPCNENMLNHAENLRQNKSRFSLNVEQILAFDSSTDMVKEIKKWSPNFNRID